MKKVLTFGMCLLLLCAAFAACEQDSSPTPSESPSVEPTNTLPPTDKPTPSRAPATPSPSPTPEGYVEPVAPDVIDSL